MRKMCVFAAFAAASLSASQSMAADVVTANSAPREGWQYGSGNNYTPSNTLLDATASAGGDELALRIHQTGQTAPVSTGNVYQFGLDPSAAGQYSFDWDIGLFNHGANSALITLTNLGTGATFSYDPLAAGNDNTAAYDALTGSYSSQNSFRFNWGGIGFNPSIDSTYSVNLSTFFGGQTQYSLTALAQFGAGAAPTGAVPEPATWAMMLLGFCAIGVSMRRKRTTTLAKAA